MAKGEGKQTFIEVAKMEERKGDRKQNRECRDGKQTLRTPYTWGRKVH
jgi:hypothetical protein